MDAHDSDDTTRPTTVLSVVLQPMVHVTDMPGTLALLEVLGATGFASSRDQDWTQVNVGGAQVGLLRHPPNPEQGEGDVELNFAATDLDEIHRRALQAGVDIVQSPTSTFFGRQLQLRTPDGLLVKVNDLTPPPDQA